MADQQHFRKCQKCKAIYHAVRNAKCAGGGDHEAASSQWYACPTQAPATGDYNGGFRRCIDCLAVYHALNSGPCSVATYHSDFLNVALYLAKQPYPANQGESGWFLCQRCNQLWQRSQEAVRCPAGGNHLTNPGAVEYFMKFGVAQPSQLTALVGGGGGIAFNDSEVLIPTSNYGPIRQLLVRAGSMVESIGVGYANGRVFFHGANTSSPLKIITLEEGEYIQQMELRAGALIDHLGIKTNLNKYYDFGTSTGGTGSHPDLFGGPVQYLFGRAGEFVEQLGFGYGQQLASLPGSIWRSNLAGTEAGSVFDDVATRGALLGKISKITVRHGEFIDKLTVQYQSGAVFTHGGEGGTVAEFVLNDDEWITEVRARVGDNVDSLQFVLSSGRMSPAYGGTGGTPVPFKTTGSVIAGFFGRASTRINAFGVCYDSSKAKKVRIKSITYDDSNFILSETPKALTSIVLNNQSSREQTTSSTLTDEVSESETCSVTVTTGNTFDVGLEVEMGPEWIKAKGSVKLGFSFETANSTQHTSTRTRTISHQVTTLVGPKASLKATACVIQGTYSVPWTAQAVMTYLDGSESPEITLHGQLRGVQWYGQSVVYEDV